MRRSPALHGGVAAIALAAAAAAAYAAAPAGLVVRVGQAPDFSRLDFQGLRRPSLTRSGQVVTLKFSGDAQPDISLLHISPPKWLKDAKATHDGGRLQLVLTLSDDADARLGAADGSSFVNLFAKGSSAPADNAKVQPVVAPAPAAATPPSITIASPGGAVKVAVRSAGDQAQLRFDFKAPTPAAVFRRGDAAWIVFGAQTKIDLSAVPLKAGQYSKIDQLSGPGWSALRITVPQDISVTAGAQDNSWIVGLGRQPVSPASAIRVTRDSGSASPALAATMAGARTPIWIADPGAGDRILVTPALGPAKGLDGRRDFTELSLLESAQGLAIEPRVGDLSAVADGDLVHIGRPSGLALSSATAASRVEAAKQDAAYQGAPRAADMPGLFDPDWAVPADRFMARYHALTIAAANEAAPGADMPIVAQMALARFLIGNDLGYEAIGVLNKIAADHPRLAGDAELRALRGVARAMVGRYDEAELDLSSPSLASDPAVAQWRGFIAVQDQRYDDALHQFDAGASAEARFPALWRSAFAQAAAQAAMVKGDTNAAAQKIAVALSLETPPSDQLKIRLLQAKLMQQTGDSRALAVFEAVSRAPDDSVAAPALLHATGLKLAAGKITTAEAISTYDGLRFRWRGDSTELEVIRTLGQLYISQGRYRQALEIYVAAKNVRPHDPVAVQIQDDGSAAFRALFLDGGADGLPPIQALGLFNDFQSFTPLGADGDEMVRRMAARLVDVDLLPDAAKYLKYQVDNRLDGVAKAQVATRLAAIYLMNRQPEQAMDAINDSRTTILPTAMNLERRRLQARALIDLGRPDDAAELLTGDNSPDAQDLRADMAWRSRAWSAAGPLFEKRLGDRWKNPAPLTSAEEGALLRAGVAYSLAGDNTSLKRMATRYGAYFDKAANPETLKVVFTDVDPGKLNLSDFGRTAADDVVFRGWVDKMKQQLRTPAKAATTQQAAVVPAVAEPAAAPKKA